MDVEWTAKAKIDMAGIWAFYERRSIRVAANIFRKIFAKARVVGLMPLGFSKELLLDDRPEGFRSIVVRPNHKIVYFVDNNKVYIVAVWDCRRDPTVLRRSLIEA